MYSLTSRLWEQWAGVVQRGKPETLALFRLAPKLAVKAPGPGAIRKLEWKTLGNKLLHNRRIVLHTESAKSYKLKIEGVIHDHVVHAKNRVEVDGKFRWLKPQLRESRTRNQQTEKSMFQRTASSAVYWIN